MGFSSSVGGGHHTEIDLRRIWQHDTEEAQRGLEGEKPEGELEREALGEVEEVRALLNRGRVTTESTD